MEPISARILITAGPTREMWDDIRFLSNLATGRTGAGIAARAAARGAGVTLITGSSDIDDIAGVRVIGVGSALEMFDAVKEGFNSCDIFISTAAVSDFRPVRAMGKISKSGAIPEMRLERNPDILAWAGENGSGRVIAGFSLNTEMDENAAREKMVDKHCNMMAVNTTDNIGSSRKNFILIMEDGRSLKYEGKTVTETADIILDLCQQIREKSL